jgi:hypothetical protein
LGVGLGEKDQSDLERILGELGWAVRSAAGRVETHRRLLKDRLSSIVCAASLTDGDWKDVLALLAPCCPEPSLIVASPCADDRLWQDVLNLGGLDVLSTPFDRSALIRASRLISQRSVPSQRPGKLPAVPSPKPERRRWASALSAW